MKRLLTLLAALALCASAYSQVPAPLELTPSEGTPNLTRELSRKIGGKAFAKKTASLPALPTTCSSISKPLLPPWAMRPYRPKLASF